jgi:hypothetical protein
MEARHKKGLKCTYKVFIIAYIRGLSRNILGLINFFSKFTKSFLISKTFLITQGTGQETRL